MGTGGGGSAEEGEEDRGGEEWLGGRLDAADATKGFIPIKCYCPVRGLIPRQFLFFLCIIITTINYFISVVCLASRVRFGLGQNNDISH
jgi:hypothetical protein